MGHGYGKLRAAERNNLKGLNRTLVRGPSLCLRQSTQRCELTLDVFLAVEVHHYVKVTAATNICGLANLRTLRCLIFSFSFSMASVSSGVSS